MKLVKLILLWQCDVDRHYGDDESRGFYDGSAYLLLVTISVPGKEQVLTLHSSLLAALNKIGLSGVVSFVGGGGGGSA